MKLWTNLKSFIKRRPGVSGAAAVAAASLVAYGGYTAGACPCVTPSGPTTTSTTTSTNPNGPLGGVTVANTWITQPGDVAGNCQPTGTPSGAGMVTYTTAYNGGGANNHTCGNYSSQFLDQAVSNARLGDTIGVPGGIYNESKQIVNYEARLANQGCDPLGTWGPVNTTNCIHFAPAQGQQPFFAGGFGFEMHSGDIWWDGSATGSVTDKILRTYSFKNLGFLDSEADSSSNHPDHNTFTGFWAEGFYMGGCTNCRYSQMQIGPRIHDEVNSMLPGCKDNTNLRWVDGTSAAGTPNPSDRAGIIKTGRLTGYRSVSGGEVVQGRVGVNAQNDVIDHTYIDYVTTEADLGCDPHDGGMFLKGNISSLLLDSNIWQQDMVYDIQIQGGNNNNVTLQNNWFGDPINDMRSLIAGTASDPAFPFANCNGTQDPSVNGGVYDGCHGPNGDSQGASGGVIQLDEQDSGWIIRYNTFAPTSQFNFNYSNIAGTCNYPNTQIYGNVGAAPTCNGAPCSNLTGITFVGYNVWTTGGPCAATDISSQNAANIMVDPSIPTMNYNLKGSSGSTVADNFVTSASFAPPAKDINGNTSSASPPWDAGAQQRSGGTGGGTLGGVSFANLWITKTGDTGGSCTATSGTGLTYSVALNGPTGTGPNVTCPTTGQWLDRAVSTAGLGQTIGMKQGVYNTAGQSIGYESRLRNLGCDPLGTWGAINTTNCIRIAPAAGEQIFWNGHWENYASDLWFDGSATGTVTDKLSRKYSFKTDNLDMENSGTPANGLDHDTFTGWWSQGMYMGGCQNCRMSQGMVGPRIHVERVNTPVCPNGVLTVDGTDGTSWPVNPSDATHLPSVGVPTGYTGDGQIPSFEGRNGTADANDVVDHYYFYYASDASDAGVTGTTNSECDPHDGGFYLRAGYPAGIQGLTIADNIWQQTITYDIQVQAVGCPNGVDTSIFCRNDNIIIENNWFGTPVGNSRSTTAGSQGCLPSDPTAFRCNGVNGPITPASGGAIQVDMQVNGWIVRYNTFAPTDQLNLNYANLCGGCSFNNMQVYGNLGAAITYNGGACSTIPGSSNVFSHNLWTNGSACNGTDGSGTASNIYTDTGITTENYLLKGAAGSTAADNFVSGAGTTAPSGSIDGGAIGSSPWDAGSQQR